MNNLNVQVALYFIVLISLSIFAVSRSLKTKKLNFLPLPYLTLLVFGIMRITSVEQILELFIGTFGLLIFIVLSSLPIFIVFAVLFSIVKFFQYRLISEEAKKKIKESLSFDFILLFFISTYITLGLAIVPQLIRRAV